MIVKHPVFPGVQVEVSDPDTWIAMGWVADAPPPQKVDEPPKPRPRRNSKK